MNADESSDESLRETILERKWVYTGGYLWVEKLLVRLPNGELTPREIARTRDSVAVLPVDTDGTVHMVRQFRVALGRTLLEVPAGLIDEGESPETAAVRECEEEAGVRPDRLIPLTRFAHAEGFATGFMYVYLGLNLSVHGRQELDATEFIEPVRMPFAELRRAVVDGRIIDSKSILAILLAVPHLGTAAHRE